MTTVAAPAPAAAGRTTRLVRVTGVVQGVGFRPFVHRLATELALAGWVRNRAGEVEIVVEGPSEALDAFVTRVRGDAPVLARIASVDVTDAPPLATGTFTIVPSDDLPGRRQAVLPDVALCARCERELTSPEDRRYRYPFITCTDCGPRYSVIERLPYDRVRTSMRVFTQCDTCAMEYVSPGDRRHHSETNSCAACGPSLRFFPASGGTTETDRDAAIEAAAAALRAGAIVAVRGLGGFHLAVDAGDQRAVSRLRERKHREAKPFAVMVRSLGEARTLAHIAATEAELLAGPERPIVLLPARVDAPLAPAVAPEVGTIGVMLAYTPLHHLLLEAVGRPLVMTSGNRGDEPIAASVEEAQRALGAIADAFLVHDREIVRPIDDSVMRVAAGAPRFLRRARGFAPLPIPMPVDAPVPVLAVGGHLKNTFTVAAGRMAYVSPHIGDLETLETLERWRDVLAGYRALHRVAPRVVARDAHPGYVSTQVAAELARDHAIVVQHHHAHVAAVMAEHGVREAVLGVAYDGTGHGDDACVWGAELLLADLTGYRRVGQLRYAPLPGGDLAVRMPWRTALGFLTLEPGAAASFALAFQGVHPKEREMARLQAERGLNAPLASSMGRLFDAAAAVMGVRRRVQFEGQAAMALEALAGRLPGIPLPFPPPTEALAGRLVLDPLPMLAALGDLAQAGEHRGALAAGVHDAISAATVNAVRRACEAHGVRTVALGGGVFQNARLLATMQEALERGGLRVLIPQALPANDGGLSYGQAVVAAAVMDAGLAQPRIMDGG